MKQANPLMAALVAVPIAFVVVIEVGYEVHARYPKIPDLVLGSAAAVALVGISFAIVLPLMGYRVHRPGKGSIAVFRKTTYQPDREAKLKELTEEGKLRKVEHSERRRIRVAQLAADPTKQKYAKLVERGEQWSDETIAYNEDRNITGTCPHLQPIEHAMRLVGIVTLLVDQPWRADVPSLEVSAQCCVNEDELKRQMLFPESVRYVEGYDSERSPKDNPWARIECSKCRSRILVFHSDYGPNRSWFPSAPAHLRQGNS